MVDCGGRSGSDMVDDKEKETELTDKNIMDSCSSLFSVKEDDLKLPYEQKLDIIKKDAETLYEFALTKGLSNSQMRTCLSPLLGDQRSVVKRVASDSSISVMKLSFVVAIVAILWGVPKTRELIQIHAKLLSVQTIRIWDWTPLYFEDCIVNNPFLPTEKNYTKDDCTACLDFQNIDRLQQVDLKMITDEYLYADYPYIVNDADKNWPRDSNGELLFSLDRLNEMFQDHPMLTEAASECEFVSTVQDYENISDFVTAFSRRDLPDKFHVAWENCDPSAAKVFRMLASRPYFIPPSAELSPHNQVIVAKGDFQEQDFELPQQIDSASWLIVLYGEMRISLIPHNDCFQFGCEITSFSVGEGEAIVVPSRIWNMTYAPTIESTYTLAYASTLLLDDIA